jgi:hypothetical protein
MEIKTVFGQNGITSIDTYFECVRYIKHGKDTELSIKVAGPDFYDNEMFMETYEKENIMKTFQQDDEPINSLDSLNGCSLMAFYQDAKLIGFQRR